MQRIGLLLLVGLSGVTIGCALSPGNLAAGARCVRSTQCAPGLVCGGGVCTSDLDGFGGTVPVVDSGVIDAPVDPDSPSLDAPVPMLDTGPGLDAPIVVIDTGPTIDSGTDAGPPPVDAPPPPPDVPMLPDTPPEIDAGELDAP